MRGLATNSMGKLYSNIEYANDLIGLFSPTVEYLSKNEMPIVNAPSYSMEQIASRESFQKTKDNSSQINDWLTRAKIYERKSVEKLMVLAKGYLPSICPKVTEIIDDLHIENKIGISWDGNSYTDPKGVDLTKKSLLVVDGCRKSHDSLVLLAHKGTHFVDTYSDIVAKEIAPKTIEKLTSDRLKSQGISTKIYDERITKTSTEQLANDCLFRLLHYEYKDSLRDDPFSCVALFGLNPHHIGGLASIPLSEMIKAK